MKPPLAAGQNTYSSSVPDDGVKEAAAGRAPDIGGAPACWLMAVFQLQHVASSVRLKNRFPLCTTLQPFLKV